jgi:hypothetical protein
MFAIPEAVARAELRAEQKVSRTTLWRLVQRTGPFLATALACLWGAIPAALIAPPPSAAQVDGATTTALIRAAIIAIALAAFLTALVAAVRGTAAPIFAQTPVRALAQRTLSEARFILAAGALLAAGLVAATSVASSTFYTGAVLSLLFASALVYGGLRGADAVRVVVAAVVVVTPFRGALLALAEVIELPHALVTVNALQPTLIAASAAVLFRHRKAVIKKLSPPLLAGWLAIAGAVALNFATTEAGLRVYALGAAQYLTYPTFALVAWFVLRREHVERLVSALVALAATVAASIVLEGIGVLHVVEAAAPVMPHLAVPRWGGSTGSYLHASMFIGTATVLLAGIALRLSRGALVATLSVVVLLLTGLTLTNSRGGFAIAAGGAFVLIAVISLRQRLALAGLVPVALAAAFVLSYAVVANGPSTTAASGPSTTAANAPRSTALRPTDVTERLRSSADLEGDPAHANRVESMKRALASFRDSPLSQQLFGQGVATTGNARKLISLEANSTESLPLKLLVEVGLVGLLAVGTFFVWGALAFLRLAWRARESVHRTMDKSIGAAGAALSAYALAFPIWEPQLIALTWWLLLVAALKLFSAEATASEPSTSGASDRPPTAGKVHSLGHRV